MSNTKAKIRVLLAKPGFDGHDRGAKVVCMLLRDAGIEVIYTGIRQSIDAIVSAAIQEGVHIIALSMLSGVHLRVVPRLMMKMKEKGISDIPVVVGGVIPPSDISELKNMGVMEVFPVHSTFKNILRFFEKFLEKNTETLRKAC